VTKAINRTFSNFHYELFISAEGNWDGTSNVPREENSV